MEAWVAIVIILETITFLFVMYGFTRPAFEQKLIDLEDRAIIKIKEKLGK